MLFAAPPVMQVGVRAFGGAVTVLRGLVIAAALIPVFAVALSTIEIGRAARATTEGGR
jgi:hypothetical protein